MSTVSENSGYLSDTGERFFPNHTGASALLHWSRYLLAREFAAGKAVLDVASGEGYGSAFLSEVAVSVIGVDISLDAVNHASKGYSKDNLQFRVGSCAAIPLPDASVDLVTSFETIEHHDQHEEMFREIVRVLKREGILIMSSPDREEADRLFGPGTRAPFHVKELNRNEFLTLVNNHFTHVALLGQGVVFGAALFLEGASSQCVTYICPEQPERSFDRSIGLTRPLNLICIASNEVLPALSSYFLEKRIGWETANQLWPPPIDAIS